MTGNKVIRRDLFKRRFDMRADLCRVLAAGMEFAALGRVDRAWDIAFQNDQLAGFVLISCGDSGKQCLGIWVHGTLEQILGFCQFDNDTQVHDGNTI